MEGRPFFSIIVPCCNVAPYLDEMAASVKGQPFADWECILSVEDSTDGTLAACEALVKSDPRFRLVSGPRSGSPATPRNRAFEVARGEYVVWLDGDDYLAEDALSRLSKAIADAGEPCDMVQCGVTEFFEDGQGRRTRGDRCFNFTPADDGRVLSGLDVLARLSSLDYFWPMASLSVCRAGFLRANGLRFQDGRKYEDEEWTPRAITFARRILVLDCDLYLYRRRAGSVTTNTNRAERGRQFAEVVRSLVRFFSAQTLPAPVFKSVANYYLRLFFEFYWLRGRDLSRAIPASERTPCLRRILEKGGRAALWKLAAHASLARRVGVALLMVAGVHPLLDLPANLYFGLYYRLVLRRTRHQKEKR
jgi:glycosyltransferase involved in cell wall biosynthesis